MIKAQTAEREEFRRQFKRSKNETENAYSFAKFECTRYGKVIQQDKVIQECQGMLEWTRQEAKETISKERFHDERYRKVCEARD